MTSSAQCVLRCDKCDQPVTGEGGFVRVDDDAAMQRLAAYADWEDRHRTPQGIVSYNMADRSDPPPEKIHWRIYHNHCDPQPEIEGYWFYAGRCTTYGELLDWTAHLLEKPWIQQTDWAATLRAILRKSGDTPRR